MNAHLSSDEIDRLVVGDASPEEEEHVRVCNECRAELMRLRETLSLFRDSLQYWSQETRGAVVPDRMWDASTGWIMPLRWVMAAGVLIVLLTLPLYKNARDRRRAAQAIEDAVLLERVNADLSRPVPAPMERFFELLSDDSGNDVGGRQ
jgi:hypothetical protein